MATRQLEQNGHHERVQTHAEQETAKCDEEAEYNRFLVAQYTWTAHGHGELEVEPAWVFFEKRSLKETGTSAPLAGV